MGKKKTKPSAPVPKPAPAVEPPLELDRPIILTGIGIALAFFILYASTMYRTIDFGDSGELIAAAHVMGVPHTPGYPLYCLLAKGFMGVLPFESPAFRVNLMSGLASAAALFLLFLAQIRLTRSKAASALGVAFLGLALTFWAQAGIGDVHGLQALLFAGLFYAAFSWWTTRRPGFLTATMACLGLAFTNHLNTIVLLPGLLFLLWKGGAHKGLKVRRAWTLLLAFGLPLLIYLYLPIRSAADPPIDMGNPQTWYNFRLHTTGHVFRYLMFQSSPEELWAHLLTFLTLIWKQFRLGLLLLPLGALFFWRRDRILLAAWAAFAVFNLAWGINYSITDIDTYYLATYMTLAFLIGGGPAWMFDRKPRALWLSAVTAGAAGLLLLNFLLHLPYNNVRDRREAWQHGMNLLRAPAPDSLVLYDTDFNGFPMLYLHYVEKVRPDLTILHYPPDFWDIENGQSKAAHLPTFREILQGLGTDGGSVSFRSEEYKDFIMNWILDHNLPGRAVYSTYSPEAPVRWDVRRHVPVHFGLMARFYPVESKPSPILYIPAYDLKSLAGRRYAGDSDAAGRDEILLRYAWNQCFQGDAYFEAKDLARSTQAYEAALKNPLIAGSPGIKLSLGRNYAVQGEAAKARPLLEEALRLDPQNPLAYQYLFNLAYLQKDFAGASHVLDEAMARFPENTYFRSLKETLARQAGTPATPLPHP
jgi:hypothetical protein